MWKKSPVRVFYHFILFLNVFTHTIVHLYKNPPSPNKTPSKGEETEALCVCECPLVCQVYRCLPPSSQHLFMVRTASPFYTQRKEGKRLTHT